MDESTREEKVKVFSHDKNDFQGKSRSGEEGEEPALWLRK